MIRQKLLPETRELGSLNQSAAPRRRFGHRDQVLFGIFAAVTAKLFVMDLQNIARSPVYAHNLPLGKVWRDVVHGGVEPTLSEHAHSS